MVTKHITLEIFMIRFTGVKYSSKKNTTLQRQIIPSAILLIKEFFNSNTLLYGALNIKVSVLIWKGKT